MRRVSLIAGAALVAALASAAPAAEVTMDGTKSTSTTHQGELSGTTAGSLNPVALFDPSPQDCEAPGTCSSLDLRLLVPRGRQTGRFEYAATMSQPTAIISAALYDAKGVRVDQPNQPSAAPGSAQITVPRLKPGRYTVVLYDHAGAGPFTATVTWRANPPQRPGQ